MVRRGANAISPRRSAASATILHRDRSGFNAASLPGFSSRLWCEKPTFDTEEIVLEICKKEGLQQIVWISRLLSASGQRDKLDAVVAEGNRRYGQAELEPRGVIHWSAGRTSALTISGDLGLRRIIMVSTGPGLDACSQEHESLTGHPVSDHWMRFLPNDAGK
jgi:hypothetical protein